MLFKSKKFKLLKNINVVRIKEAFIIKFVIIPPVYEVYRGYIVFAFSVTMFVCLCVNFFSVKDFSGTT